MAGTPSLLATKSTKKIDAKLKRKKNDNQQQSMTEATGGSLGSTTNGTTGQDGAPHSHGDHVSTVGGPLLSPGGTMGQNQDLALSDTDLANVKFKLSASEAMLYLQSTSTTVSQLFKYDGQDGVHATDSASGLECIGIEGSNGQSSNSILAGSGLSPSPLALTSSMSVRGSGRAGMNGCSRNSRQELRGKRGPEEAARARKEEDEEEEKYMTLPTKKQLMASGEVGVAVGSGIMGRSHYSHARLPSRSSLSTPPLTPISPTLSQHSHSRPSSGLNSPEPTSGETVVANAAAAAFTGVGNGISDSSNLTAYISPCGTPHSPPVHSPPHQSPLHSPPLTPYYQHHLLSAPHALPTPTPHPHSVSTTATSSVSGKVMPPTKNLHTGPLNMSTSTQVRNYLAASPPSALSSLNLPGFSTARGGFFQFQHRSNPVGEPLPCDVM